MSSFKSFSSVGKIAGFLGKKAVPGIGQISTALEALDMAEEVWTSLAKLLNGDVKPGPDLSAFLSGEAAAATQVIAKLRELKKVVPMFLSSSGAPATSEVRKKAQYDALALAIAVVDVVLGEEVRVLLEDTIESNTASQILGNAEIMMITYPKTIGLIYSCLHNSYRLGPYREIIGIHDLAGYTVSVKNGKTVQGSILSYLTDPGRILDKMTSPEGVQKMYTLCFPLSLKSNGAPDILFDKAHLEGKSSDGSKSLGEKMVENIQSLANEFTPSSDLVEDIDTRHAEVYTRLVLGISPVTDPVRFINIISNPFSSNL